MSKLSTQIAVIVLGLPSGETEQRFRMSPHRPLFCFVALGAAVLWAPFAYAHGDSSTLARTAGETWPLALLVLAASVYARGLHRVIRSAGAHRRHVIRCGAMFALGSIALGLAFASPLLDATRGVFSLHMVQHELLMVLGAPLMVVGRPLAIWTWALSPRRRRLVARPFRSRVVRRVWAAAASTPITATILHAMAIWLWHVPALFERAEASLLVHALQHCAFLFSALLFWWALLKPGHASQIGAAVLCLFITMLQTGALGVLLTFSGKVWYGVSTSGAAQWGLSPLEDQQLGGLVMWVPGGIPYVVAALVLAARWFTRENAAGAPSVALGLHSR